jgi:hypothetical protein
LHNSDTSKEANLNPYFICFWSLIQPFVEENDQEEFTNSATKEVGKKENIKMQGEFLI